MLRRAKKGQSLIEYGLIIALVAVVAVAVVNSMGGSMASMGDAAVTQMDTAAQQVGTFDPCASVGKTRQADGSCQ